MNLAGTFSEAVVQFSWGEAQIELDRGLVQDRIEEMIDEGRLKPHALSSFDELADRSRQIALLDESSRRYLLRLVVDSLEAGQGRLEVRGVPTATLRFRDSLDECGNRSRQYWSEDGTRFATRLMMTVYSCPDAHAE
ncbi:MAG: hypothetical protein NXI30_16930 [bacterium]|nr:hypothetical protein [bacterium]